MRIVNPTRSTQVCLNPQPESESESHSVMSDSLRPHGLYSPWNSPGQNTGVGSLSLLQGIFPTQGSNPGLPHCRQILYQLSPKGTPRIPAKNAKTGKLHILANVVLTRLFWPGCTTCYINSVCFLLNHYNLLSDPPANHPPIRASVCAIIFPKVT